jgi:hypothetical protein
VLWTFLPSAHGHGRADPSLRTWGSSEPASPASRRVWTAFKPKIPSRERRLRSYRDENLAHELYFEQPRPKALYGYIPDLLHEVLQLTEDVGLIVQGTNYFWDEGEAERSATALWSAVAAAFPRRNSLLRTE